jgi:hypothetical protein
VLAVADPADSLGLSDIAVMTKLPVRPAVAARSQIVKLLDKLVFMEEPAQGASEAVSTVIVPPDGEAASNPPAAPPARESDPVPTAPPSDAVERELARLREELALAIVDRDQLMAKLTAMGEQSASVAEEALSALRLEHERELAAAEAAAEEALRAERASAQQALTSLRANHEEALDKERAKRVDEVEAERERTAAAIDAERERNQKELEALRARLTEELETAREQGASAPPADAARMKQLEQSLTSARDQLVLTADADRRAEGARAALAALRDESERQAQVHALAERELRAELDRVRGELESLKAELGQATRE